MITALTIISLAFTWLLYESDWLRVNLAELAKLNCAGYRFYSTLSRGKYHGKAEHRGGNIEWVYNDYPKNGNKIYDIIVSPGINNVLCGWEWLDKHCADLVDYQLGIEMNMGGVRYKMHIKAPNILKDVMKANRLSKAEKLQYA